MDNSTQNGAPVFVAPTPIVGQGVYYTSPDSAYPQVYIVPQQQPPASGKSNVLIGKTSVIVLGVALLICGVLSQIGAAVGFRVYAGLSEVGVGVWCGYMFVAEGAVAIVAAHHGTKKLIIGTTVTSALAVAAAITQLTAAGIGLANDVDYFDCYTWCYPNPYYSCFCYSDDWQNSAIGANSTMVFAASFALICGVWLLVAASIAVHRKQTSFQVASTPDQFVSDASQPNIYESTRNQQMHSTPVQHVPQQQPQQLMALNHANTNTIFLPMSSQVVQMPAAYIPLQTMTTSTIPNEQVIQVPVQFILNALQHHFNEEMRNQQMLSIPTQYVQQRQQLISLNVNHPPTNTINTATSAQVHHEASRNVDRDAEKF